MPHMSKSRPKSPAPLFEPLEDRTFLSVSGSSVTQTAPAPAALTVSAGKSGKTLALRQSSAGAATLRATPFKSGKTLALRNANVNQLIASADGHALTYPDGTPFFYMGEAAWHLFDKTTRAEADLYLSSRAALGFTVIEPEVNARFSKGNAYGDKAFVNNDPLTPNEAYFQYVDYVVAKANSLGLWVAMVPLDSSWSADGKFDAISAWQYGRFLGRRYGTAKIIWTMGGDVAGNDNPLGPNLWREVVAGIARGATNRDVTKLTVQYHPTYLQTSATWFNNDAWLDMNNVVSGHGANATNYTLIAADYARTPHRPAMDIEPVYEDIPYGINPANPRATDWDVRKTDYWALFAGAHGVTFGNNNVWQFAKSAADNNEFADASWKDSLNSLGAYSMRYIARLMGSRPLLNRVPDQSLLVSAAGTGANHNQATRAADGSYAFVYLASGGSVTINLGKLSGTQVNVRWYSPRTGRSSAVTTIAKSGNVVFAAPSAGAKQDWVLIIDDSARNYGKP